MPDPRSAFPDDEQPPRPPSGLGAMSAFPESTDPLRQTLDQALTTTPDLAARVFNLRLKTGLPAGVIERSVDEIERQAARQDFDPDRFRRESPLLADWLTRNPEHAALTRDDLVPLSQLDRALQFGGKVAGAVSGGFYGASANFYGAVQGFIEAAQHEGGREAEHALIAGGMSRAEARAARAAAFAQPPPSADVVAGIRQHLQAVATTKRGRTGDEGLVERSVLSGVESLTQSALLLPLSLLTKSPAPLVAGMGLLTGGGAYGTARDAGTSVETALGYGTFQGAVEAATEFIPAHKLLGDLATHAPLWKTLLHQAAAEIPGEQVATALQDLAEWAVLHPERPFTNYLAERPSAAAETLIATIVATGLQTGAVHQLDRLAGGSASEQVLEDLHTATAASKTRERAPDALHAFVEQASQGGLTHVYAPADTFTAYFQSKGENPAQVALQLTGDPEAYRLAVATGGDLAIPTARYLSRVVGSGHESFFTQELRLAPDQLNARETSAEIARQAQLSTASEDAAVGQAAVHRQTIVQDVAQRLTATGRYTPEDAATQAALVASMFEALPPRPGENALTRFRAWAARSGGGVAAADTISAGRETIVSTNDAGEGATFLGWQETPDGPPIALYNVVGGALDRSTVTAATLEARGIPVPDTPTAPETFAPELFAQHALAREGETVTVHTPTIQVLEDRSTPQVTPGAADVDALAQQLRDTLANVPTARQPGQPRTEFFQARPLDTGEQAVASRFEERLAHPDAEEAYSALPDTQGGKILDTDQVRELSDDYRADRLAWGDATHAAASAFIKRQWLARLAQPAQGPAALFAGGGGSGKSTIQKGLARTVVDAADVVHDGVQGRYEPTVTRIEHALATDRPVELAYVHLPFAEAAPRVLARAETQGRMVPLEVLAGDHVGAQETFYRLVERYQDDPRVTVRIYDNSGAPHEITLQQLVAARYNRASESLEQTAARLQEELPDDVRDRFRRLDDRSRRLRGERRGDVRGRDDAGTDSAGGDRRGDEDAGRPGAVAGDPGTPGPDRPGAGPRQPGTRSDDLTQGDDQPLGAFDPVSRLIRLLPGANRSTFLHELAHLFLELRSELAVQTAATPQERADMATLLRRFGFDGDLVAWRALTHEQRRAHHEQFADAFEDYVAEGKAPTPELQPLFARFWSWLTAIYKQLRRSQVPLADDVRAVMDRMVASEQAIAAAQADAGVRALFLDAATAGVSPQEFEGYRAHLQAASDAARARLQSRLMRELAREQQQAWQEERETVRAAAAAAIQQQPVYRALAGLRGRQADGSPLPDGVSRPTLNKDLLVRQFGEDVLAKLPKGVPPLYSVKGGLPADVVAETFGFPSGQALVDALIAAPPLAAAIDTETDRRMEEEHGSLLTDPVQLAEEARDAIADEHRDTVIRAELRMLQRLRAAAEPSVRAARAEGETAARDAQRERDYERRWLEAEARLRIAIAEGRAQVEIDALQAEVRALQANIRGGAARIRAELPSAETLARLAQGQVASMTLADIRPDRFFAAARRASRRATETAARHEFDAAIRAKRDELVNLALYREAVKARAAVEDALGRFAKLFTPDGPLAARRNLDYVHAARAIAAVYFWPTRRLADAREALDLVKKYDPALHEMLAERVQAALAGGSTLEALTFDAFTVVEEAIDALWAQSLREQQLRINGQLVDRNDAIAALEQRFDELGTARRQARITPTGKVLLGGRAWLARVEHWVDYMDGGDPNGVFRRYFWTPISEATARYRLHKADYLQRYLALVTSIEQTLVSGPIAAPELPGGEGDAHYTFESKAALLHALLHTGNQSNYEKLIRGYGWGDYQADDTVDDSKWRAFLRRMHQDGVLTKTDWEFVQATWDLVAQLKPEAQQAHRDMYGHYFSEITEWAVDTPFGSYRGGYVPALVDPLAVEEAGVKQSQAELLEGADNAFMFPTTGRGFTKARIEAYAKPLALNLSLIPQHLDKVLRFIHLEPVVRDTARLVLTHRVRDRLAAHDPTARSEMLIPWLQRAASQRVSQPGKWPPADRFFRAVRTRTGLNLMAANVVNTLQQVTGLSVSATKVKPRYLRNALWRYTTDHKAFVAAIHEASQFMRTRLTAQAFEIQRTIDDLLLNPSKYARAREFGQAHGYFMQAGTQNIVDLVTWAGAYEQAMEAGADERDAVRQADSAVRETQGSFAPEDVARIEAQTPFVRMFTMFSGYFNMLANLNGTQLALVARDMGLRKGAGRALYLYTFGFMLPAVLSEAIQQGIRGDLLHDDDDDGYLDALMALFFGSQARTIAAMAPGGLLTAAYNYYATGTPSDDRISSSPAITLLESAIRAPGELYAAVVEDGPKKRAVRDVLDAIGLLTGLPVGAIKRPAAYLADVAEGRAQPENPLELAQGLVSGRAPER